ncbi:MAG: threonine--tRNA ligase [Candidatus Doudnabacteria bacterium]
MNNLVSLRWTNSRHRAFAQDDAADVSSSPKPDEITSIWEIVEEFYQPFGFELKVRLSMRDPQNPDNYLGGEDKWQIAEQALREIAQSKQIQTFDGIGEAAFYGPKLDFIAQDAIGREWQVATIQLDMNMPERFDLSCVNEQGEDERIVMIHAAIMGSIERFMGILIEHTNGNFPFWLSPIQATIIPIAEAHHDYAKQLAQTLKQSIPELRLSTDDRTESIGKRIREASKEKVPYILVVGDKEQDQSTIAVRGRGDQDLGTLTQEELIAKFNHELSNRI